MPSVVKPSLYGLRQSNRDFSSKDSWGKNKFNSAFPAALCCFLESIGETAVYLNITDKGFDCGQITVTEAFNVNPLGNETYYAFETAHTPYQRFVIGSLPRTDLVIQDSITGECLSGLEVKLTTLPDNTTCDLSEDRYGSEIVVRPDTIVYLACSIAKAIGNELNQFEFHQVDDWTDARKVLTIVPHIISTLKNIAIFMRSRQTPFLLQPIWKTNGKSPELSENCLDVFFWSDASFSYFISDIADPNMDAKSINRQTRTAVWLYKMLLDIKDHGRFDHKNIIDVLSFNTKNDKAFASAGNVTNRYMSCDRLLSPKIGKNQIKEIILGGGQTLLSPERRFDAIIYNSPELFI